MTETKDNPDLMKKLDEFNKGSTEKEEPKDTNEKETTSDEEVWLIEDKFKDNEEGRKALAEGYRNIQSRAEKAETAFKPFQGKEEYFETLSQLDSFLQNNPKAVKAMQNVIQEDKKIKPPAKPEDYDILDESIEGSSSQKWRQEQDKYLIHLGGLESAKQIDAFRKELGEKEETRNFNKEEQKFKKELKELGLSDDEMKEFDIFMKEPNNRNTKTLVEIWRFLTKAPQKIKKNTTAAAIPGVVTTSLKPDDKEKAEFWGDIMKYSN